MEIKESKNHGGVPKKKENMHKGHRERFRKRFMQNGIESFSFHERIEFLLFYAKPQVNTNEEAHIFADAFNNSIVDMFEADISTLMNRGKLSQNVAIYIKFLHEMIKSYNVAKINDAPAEVGSLENIKKHLVVKYTGVSNETVILISLNNRMEIIADEIIHVGSVNSAYVNAGVIAKTAFLHNASGVILAHNHPGGLPIPSPEDIATTRKIKNILSDVSINLIEHYIVADNRVQEISYSL